MSLSNSFSSVSGFSPYPAAAAATPTSTALTAPPATSFPGQPSLATAIATARQLQPPTTAATIRPSTTTLQIPANQNLPFATYGKFRGSGNFHRGAKRKISSDDAGSTGSGAGSDSGAVGDGTVQPLYCKTYRVTLNAPAQAKQHYEGKSHSKKVKMFMDGTTDEESSEVSVTSSFKHSYCF